MRSHTHGRTNAGGASGAWTNLGAELSPFSLVGCVWLWLTVVAALTDCYCSSLDQKLFATLSSLVMSKYIVTEAHDHSRVGVSSEGETYRVAGAPEAQIFNLLPAEGSVSQKTLEERVGKALFQLGLNQCMSKRWVEFDGDKKAGMLKRKMPQVVDEVQQGLQAVHDGTTDAVAPALIDILKKRGLVVTTTWKTYGVKRGAAFARVRKVLATDLTVDMLKGDKWSAHIPERQTINGTLTLHCIAVLCAVFERAHSSVLFASVLSPFALIVQEGAGLQGVQFRGCW